MPNLFQTGNGVSDDRIIVGLELVDVAWFKAAFMRAISYMCDENNWIDQGDAGIDYARDKANEMLESVTFNMKALDIGSVVMWMDNTIPLGYRVCNGQAISRTTFQALFDLWGVQFGAGDGSTTFNLPDLRDRSPMGVHLTVGLGNTAGEAEHQLTPLEMPSHTHTFIGDQHNHLVDQYNGVPGGTTPRFSMPNGGLAAVRSTGSTYASGTNETAGGDGAHNNIHPVLGVHFVVWTGVYE